jgi:hypothetical protein
MINEPVITVECDRFGCSTPPGEYGLSFDGGLSWITTACKARAEKDDWRFPKDFDTLCFCSEECETMHREAMAEGGY